MYIINKTDGTELAIILEGIVNTTSTDIGLIGKNVPNYGEILNENLVKILENFANTTPPINPLVGEIWYDKSTNSLKVYNSQWNTVGNATVAANTNTPTNNTPGNLWFNTTTQQLFVYDEAYKVIGPEAAEGFAITRLQSATVKDIEATNRPIIKGYINNEILFVVAASDFNTTEIPGFPNVKRGINLNNDVSFYGALSGNASTATKLLNARYINNGLFDGTQNITITANTPNSLSNGNYLLGSSFNGGSAVTWNVDATSFNTSGKIVARDQFGRFSASEVTANLVGNVTGNVSGDVTGSLNGPSYGNHQGNLVANDATVAYSSALKKFTGDLTGNVTGNLTGNVTGDVTGNLFGNAASATKLQFVRNINGVDFDGTQDIVVKARTPFFLNNGNYIVGTAFDGGSSITWAVDATSANVENKVVVRNGSGNFSANVITASLTGNVTGNVTGNLTGDVKAADNSTAFSASSKQFTANKFNVAAGTTNGIWWPTDAYGGAGDTAGIYLTTSSGEATKLTIKMTNDADDTIVLDATGGVSVTNSITSPSFVGNVTGNVTGSLYGNADTATKFETPRTINGVTYDGTRDITVYDNSKVPLSGGTMSGHLTLNANPTEPLHAATKQYVDSLVLSRPISLSLDTRGLDLYSAGSNSVVAVLNAIAPTSTLLAGTIARISSSAQNVTSTASVSTGRIIGLYVVTGVSVTTTVSNPTRNNNLVYRVNSSRTSWEYVSG